MLIPDVVLYSQQYNHLECIRGNSYVPETAVIHYVHISYNTSHTTVFSKLELIL